MIKRLNTFEGRSIILQNQNKQVYILYQETKNKKILLYELKENNILEILYTCNGLLYDVPEQYETYFRSKIHIIDEKNNRIIFVKRDSYLSYDLGYPHFTIVGLNYKGNHLFSIDLDEVLAPISISAYKNGDLLLGGKYNKWLDQRGGKSHDCIMRVSAGGNIVWKKTKELSCNQFEGRTWDWDEEEVRRVGINMMDWGRSFLSSDDKILIETVAVYDFYKSYFELFKSDEDFIAELGGKNLCMQKVTAGSLIQIEENHISMVEERESFIIRTIFDNEGLKLSEDRILPEHRPKIIDIKDHGVAALYPGYIKYQSFSGIDISVSMNTKSIIVDIKSVLKTKPIIFIFENGGGWDTSQTIKVYTENGIIETMLEADFRGYIQTIYEHDHLLCLWNESTNNYSILFSIKEM